MADPTPQPDPNPFEGLPEELAAMLEQLGGPEVFQQIGQLLQNTGSGPVNWELAGQVARQLAVVDDRAPTPAEIDRINDAQQLAEHWLDAGSLPAPREAGRTKIGSRQEWVGAALESLRPVIEPVAAASTGALADMAASQMDDTPLAAMLGDLGPLDVGEMLRPMGAILAGIQTGQVVGRLSQQLLGQYALGIPTAETGTVWHVAVNIGDVFDGYDDLDPTEIAIVLALHEGAMRRLYHAVPWLPGHVHQLVATFASGTQLDREQLFELSNEIALSFDPDDPDSLTAAMESAADFRVEPTDAQRRVLERLQGVVCLIQAWARHAVAAATADRLPDISRIEEVLRRRRATRGDGEQMLQQLLGLDLKPEDESVGDRFIAAVAEAGDLDGLHRALGHPENLPDTGELADPHAWLLRMAAGESVPDDASSLFDSGEGPHEESSEERFGDLDG